MINIITSAELDVISKQRALVEEAIGPDSAYARFKENLIEIMEAGQVQQSERGKLIGETLSQMAIGITSSAMSIGLQWAAQENDSSFKKEELSRTLELLEKQIDKATQDATGSIAQKQMIQAQMLRDYGSPILDNEGNVVALPDSGRIYEMIVGIKQENENKKDLNDQILAQTDEVYARTHRLIADTYVNHGVYSWTTLQKNGVAGVTKATTGYTTLSDLQKVVTGEQAKGYAYNAWGNAASASGGMIGTLVAAEIPGLDPATYLNAWLNSVTKINAVTAPTVTM